jgi:hypothetical protein
MRTLLFSFFFFAQLKSHAGWSIDLTRRQVDFNRITDQRMPASNMKSTPGVSNPSSEVVDALKNIVNPIVPSQEIVIVQNENGFVPNTIQLKKDEVYQIYILNLNSKEKNVSFLLESFDQSHSTFFGVMKSFKISPKLEGVFSYQSPETGSEGKIVVVDGRKPASD